MQVEQEKVRKIVGNAPLQIVEISAAMVRSLCMKMNVPVCEAEECVKKVKGCDMGYLFENMEKWIYRRSAEKLPGPTARSGRAQFFCVRNLVFQKRIRYRN